ncbi:hypothetical protein BT96DRAFT_1021489 [Gymnopus androsaceus JB14]|uniref:Uncharacterized protein n=1 Tax=Gymnopus androsaceus JB14 TaxID=1447944 RepID=A0A6A4HEH6_9AGAR|nr:hypothetical protein BT96DRAFT_1021489 [Gymnopus androsaceus JB14]
MLTKTGLRLKNTNYDTFNGKAGPTKQWASISSHIHTGCIQLRSNSSAEECNSIWARSLKSLWFTGAMGKNAWSCIIDPFILVTGNSPALEDLSLDFSGYDQHIGILSFQEFLQSVSTTHPLKLHKPFVRTPGWDLRINRASSIHLKNLTTFGITLPFTIIFPVRVTSFRWRIMGCSVLGHHGARLKHLYAPVTAELVDYIETYSGIEYLRLYHVWSCR